MRSHHALKAAWFAVCGHCGRETVPHLVCKNCGYYGSRQVVDVLAKLDKKERKKKEKELHLHETASTQKDNNLNAEELSHR